MDSASSAMLQFVSKQFHHDVNSPYVKELKEKIKELTKENNELKLDNFRKDHKYSSLVRLQKQTNKVTLRCNCNGCCENGIWKGNSDPTQTCRYNNWFKERLAACDLTCTHVTEPNLHAWIEAGTEYTTYDVDTDFVELRNYYNGTYISKFIYGPSITRAEHFYDEALGKLDHLFDTMREAVYEAVEAD